MEEELSLNSLQAEVVLDIVLFSVEGSFLTTGSLDFCKGLPNL